MTQGNSRGAAGVTPGTADAFSPRMLLLRQPVFRVLWIASLATNLGAWLQQVLLRGGYERHETHFFRPKSIRPLTFAECVHRTLEQHIAKMNTRPEGMWKFPVTLTHDVVT